MGDSHGCLAPVVGSGKVFVGHPYTLGITENFRTHRNGFKRLGPRGPGTMGTWHTHDDSPSPVGVERVVR